MGTRSSNSDEWMPVPFSSANGCPFMFGLAPCPSSRPMWLCSALPAGLRVGTAMQKPRQCWRRGPMKVGAPAQGFPYDQWRPLATRALAQAITACGEQDLRRPTRRGPGWAIAATAVLYSSPRRTKVTTTDHTCSTDAPQQPIDVAPRAEENKSKMMWRARADATRPRPERTRPEIETRSRSARVA